jgi:hypothetical protein
MLSDKLDGAKRHYVTAKDGGDGDFDLFVKVFRKILAPAKEALDAKGNKATLRFAFTWQIHMLERMLEGWPTLTREQREYLTTVRDAGQMFGIGGCAATCALDFEAKNPNWPKKARP